MITIQVGLHAIRTHTQAPVRRSVGIMAAHWRLSTDIQMNALEVE